MIAINTIRQEPHYRRAAFDVGLERLGYKMVTAGLPANRQDLLILWNLHGGNEQRRDDWEAKGGTAIVVENGYIGKDAEGRQLYAISVHGHNGSGVYPIGPEDRFQALGIDVAPWGGDEGHILVAGQRGIGSRLMASPAGWEDRTVQQLKKMGHANIKLRRHPGRFQAATTLEQDLDGARAIVIWSSASGVRALTLGVPVIYCAPHWVCWGAATRGLESMNALAHDDVARRSALHAMSHGQWTVEEIEAGEPFARILDMNLGDLKW